MKLLVVEDDPSLREGMLDLLSELGEVDAVSEAGQAERALGSQRYDLVLSDLRIGADRGGGRRVVGAARTCGVPVAIMSAATPEEIERALVGLAPDAVLAKPFQIGDLEALVARFRPRRAAG